MREIGFVVVTYEARGTLWSLCWNQAAAKVPSVDSLSVSESLSWLAVI